MTYNIKAVQLGHFDTVPEKSTVGSAGYDLRSAEDLLFYRNDIYTVRTGVSLEMPGGVCGWILPRSSLHKKGLSLANTVGLIDSDYRGEIILMLKYNAEIEG